MVRFWLALPSSGRSGSRVTSPEPCTIHDVDVPPCASAVADVSSKDAKAPTIGVGGSVLTSVIRHLAGALVATPAATWLGMSYTFTAGAPSTLMAKPTV